LRIWEKRLAAGGSGSGRKKAERKRAHKNKKESEDVREGEVIDRIAKKDAFASQSTCARGRPIIHPQHNFIATVHRIAPCRLTVYTI
jgi:hypothetical protein